MLATFSIFLGLALAAPLQKRALSENDTNVLHLAQYLEHLEYALYTGGCDNFTDAQYTTAGFPSNFRAGVCLTATQEMMHAQTIGSVLEANGAAQIPPCTYSFPYTDPKSFVVLANMVTSVGIGAYLGESEASDSDLQSLHLGGPSLWHASVKPYNSIMEEASASILTVEARHDAFLRMGLGANPFPTTFDTGLSAVWAFNLAQMFIVQCPMQLPIIQLPKLNLKSPTPSPSLQPPVPAGTVLTFSWDLSQFFIPVDPSAPLYIAMVNQNVSAPTFEEITKTSSSTGTDVEEVSRNGQPGSAEDVTLTAMATGTAKVPAGVGGAVFACLTTFSSGLTLDNLTSFGTLAGPIEILLS